MPDQRYVNRRTKTGKEQQQGEMAVCILETQRMWAQKSVCSKTGRGGLASCLLYLRLCAKTRRRSIRAAQRNRHHLPTCLEFAQVGNVLRSRCLCVFAAVGCGSLPCLPLPSELHSQSLIIC